MTEIGNDAGHKTGIVRLADEMIQNRIKRNRVNRLTFYDLHGEIVCVFGLAKLFVQQITLPNA